MSMSYTTPYTVHVQKLLKTLRETFTKEGFTHEADLLAPVERTLLATASIFEQNGLPGDITTEQALAYLNIRADKEATLALQAARDRRSAAEAFAKEHWQATVEAHRKRTERLQRQQQA